MLYTVLQKDKKSTKSSTRDEHRYTLVKHLMSQNEQQSETECRD